MAYRRHDDVHYPFQGKGKRAVRVKGQLGEICMCRQCGMYPAVQAHLCTGVEPDWLRHAREMGEDQ